MCNKLTNKSTRLYSQGISVLLGQALVDGLEFGLKLWKLQDMHACIAPRIVCNRAVVLAVLFRMSCIRGRCKSRNLMANQFITA